MDLTIVSTGLLLGMLAIYGLVRRVPANLAYIRTGLGKDNLLLANRWYLALPILYRTKVAYLHNFTIPVIATGESALITTDPLKLDIKLALVCRISASEMAIKQAIEGFRGEPELAKVFIQQRCLNLMQTLASQSVLANVLKNPIRFESQLFERLVPELALLGIEPLLVSICSISQTNLAYYNPNSSLLDAQALLVFKQQRLEHEYQLHQSMSQTALAVKHLELEATQKLATWQTQTNLAVLEQKRYELELSSKIEHELAEMAAAQQLALGMMQQDLIELQQHKHLGTQSSQLVAAV